MKINCLEIKYSFSGAETILHPALLSSEHELILVDCGYEGSLPLIEKAMNQIGFSLKNLTSIIVTHHDIDHIGGLHEIKEVYPHVKVCSSSTEANYVNGRKKSLRMLQAQKIYPELPESEKANARYFQLMLTSVKPVNVDYVFTTDDFKENKDLRIIPTPGHMPGHISIYLYRTKTLIAGDALVIENGHLNIANPQYTLNLPAAIRSIEKLIELEINELICYHGGIVRKNVKQQLIDLRKSIF
ncbi:MBL fold metallo-hydrolase [Pedobacter panaciterrae]|uniref:MBL fold metallo-hydrolase n=1 Tax=Pedobacter panaciterrae TaxID=363849 RepID=A0ABU8NU29_9SPHI|nr:MBL fold metallo-hydrolase [uncultured Pedobacter sp.]